ncbi:hypothetical protein HYR69_03945 [Candidatus Sumerlaeota bacterium]|nr:hypothetical protein [Candidatus Sumerlaeota bacterium]
MAKLAAVEDFKVEDALSYVLPEFNAGDWNSRNHEEQLGEIENAVQTLINRYSEGRYIKWSQLGETYIGIADYEDYDRTPLNETLLEQRFFETLIYMDDPIVEYDEVMEGKRAIVLEPTFSRTGAHLIGKNEKSIIFLRAGFLFYDLGPHSFRHVAVSNMPSGILNAFVVNGYLYLFTEDSHPRGGQVKRARFPDLSPP